MVFVVLKEEVPLVVDKFIQMLSELHHYFAHPMPLGISFLSCLLTVREYPRSQNPAAICNGSSLTTRPCMEN